MPPQLGAHSMSENTMPRLCAQSGSAVLSRWCGPAVAQDAHVLALVAYLQRLGKLDTKPASLGEAVSLTNTIRGVDHAP